MKAHIIAFAAAALLTLGACTPPASTETPPADTAQTTVAAAGDMCGGIAAIQCGEALYCQMAEGQCLTPDASGTCAARPQSCTEQYDPVCGCDGVTHGNACSAQMAGVNVASAGECPSTQPAPAP